MRKALANGSLLWLIGEMPKPLEVRLRAELKQLDEERRKRNKPGDTRLVSLANHLRWVSEHQAELGEVNYALFDVLKRYFPLTDYHMQNNELPSHVDCIYFWGRELSRIEKESTKLNSISA